MGDFDFDFELDATDQGPLVAWFIVLWIMLKADSAASFGIRISFSARFHCNARETYPSGFITSLYFPTQVTRHSHRR